MKKILKVGVIVIVTFFLYGCGKSGSKNKKVITCSQGGTTQTGAIVDYNYKITAGNDIVKLVQTEEHITFTDISLLENYKKRVENVYSQYDDIKYYDYNLEIRDNTLIITVHIDYDKIDMNEMEKINPAITSYIKNGALNVDDLVSIYQSLGNTCVEE